MSGFRLTPLQQGMLYHHLRAPHSGVDIEQMVVRLREPIDPDAFRRAWQALANAHSVFRSSFEWDGLDQPQQREHPQIEMEWQLRDLRGLGGDEQKRCIDEFLRKDRERGFDLKTPPLTRGALFQRDAAEWEFVWTFHHISADGGSYPALIHEAFAAYDAICAGKAPQFSEPPPFRDFITWLDQHLVENEPRAKAFWQETLRGFTAPTPLPGTSAGTQEKGVREQALSLSAEATARLRAFAQAHGLGMSTLLHASWALLLAAHSNEEDILFGETRACRRGTIPGAEEIVGGLINTVPVRIQVKPDARLVDWLKEIRAFQNALRAVEHTPLAELQRWSEVPAKTSLFDSLIVFTPRLIGALFREQGGAWAQREIHFIEQTSFPLTLFGYNESALLLKLAYDRGRFSDRLIERLLKELVTVLEAMPLDPERRVADLPLIPAEERQLLVSGLNDTARDYERAQTIHGFFEAQVERTPDVTAVVFRDEALTYRELNSQANQLARRLQSLGAGPDRIVGIFLKRSTEMMVALLGVLKSGAAYLPLDPTFPEERLLWMLEDTKAPIVITQQDLVASLPVTQGAQILCVDGADRTVLRSEPSTNLGKTAEPHHLAYVIFTSGSTGRPKGVMIEHRNVANFFAGMDDSLQFREAGTWLAVTSISFDISVLELFWTLARGFKVVIQEEAMSAARRDQTSSSLRGAKMDFSLFYFAADAGETPENKYRLLLEGARYADQNGFTAVWTPERHFHGFGGLYPNPSVTSAALATITSKIQLRAGSIVLPLHNPIRIAEEWAVVDNLSGGRVGLSFASGWHANDFALAPENYASRRKLTFEGIETIRRLWRGEAVKAKSGSGAEIELRIYPAALQKNPPVWVTAATSVDTFRMAGEIGANVLTNLLGQKVVELAGKIAAYREARRAHGHAGDGIVSLMLHTFVGRDLDEVRAKVRRPFLDYLKTSTDLVKQARWEFPAFATARGLQAIDDDQLSPEDIDALMDHAFERYFETSGLFGTPDTCLDMIARLTAIGVNEVACLIDFGVDTESVLQSLTYLNQLRERSTGVEDDSTYSIAAQLARHKVTHLQCTPSLAGVLMTDPDAKVGLRSLNKFLLGGEALPPHLAAQVTAHIAGDLINMYGPTETTVWSATAAIRTGSPITIGRPIANTQIYLVDRQLGLAPLGAAGELLIGGDGVTRGYLNRPELTAERFIPDRFGNEVGARLYRTGDLARYREDGTIEFLGRLDHQAKIRGYRIELGEIEAALSAHPRVRESVVVIRESETGERSLVAYVAAGGASADATQWQEIWNEAYDGGGDAAAGPIDPTLNTAGWISSFTGELIPDAEMREWVERTVERVGALKPRRILEIGCGTGMLLLRLAPSCERYHGVDFSPAALRHVDKEVARQGLRNVTLQQAAADALSGLEPGSFDLIMLNSVIQYFPSVDYLLTVLDRIAPLLAPGGAIFIGDVRDLRLLKAFHTAIELERAPDSLNVAELRRRLQQRAARDNELVLDPDFFRALPQQIPTVRQVDILLKGGRSHNEMTRFRYDAILRTVPSSATDVPANAKLGGVANLAAIRDRLAAAPPYAAFTGLRNPRLAEAVRAVELIASEDCPETVGEIRRALAASRDEGIDPEALSTLDLPYEVQLTWSAEGLDRYDAIFRHRSAAPQPAGSLQPLAKPRRAWADYANSGDNPAVRANLPAELKEQLKRRLPDYMVPATIMVLDSLPRTPNGKLDRKALPAPERAQEAAASAAPITYTAPQNELETAIASVWRDVLNLEKVGTHDNFFDLGANSLIMMQANARLKELLKRNLRLVDLFQYPTVSALAAHLGRANDDAGAHEASQQRGQARLDALRRRRVDLRK